MRITANGAPGTSLRWGTGPTPFGTVLAVFTDRGLCMLRLVPERRDLERSLAEVQEQFAGPLLKEDHPAARDVIAKVLAVLAGEASPDSVALDVPGTPFQKRVWQELLRLRPAETCSYAEVARRIGRPAAARAVGTACARNPIVLLIPCHRVLRADGSLGGYYWGAECKRRILEWEEQAGQIADGTPRGGSRNHKKAHHGSHGKHG